MSTEPVWKQQNRVPRILIVDDDIEIAAPVKYAMENLGYEVAHMPDGQAGIAKLESYDPDLMILDMMMPRQSGFLVLEHLRKTQRNQIRVIMVTGNEGQRHRAYAQMLGVDEYLHKPFSMEELVGHVQRLLDQPFPDGESEPI